MSKKTHTNPFSRREVEQLRRNPNVASVTANTVRFTESFKTFAYDNKCKGISVAETMRRSGIEPEILGESRIRGFSYQLNRKARREGGFSDRRKETPKTGDETMEQRIRQLENELAYTRQEVEFLKKLQAANMEAQKQWESRHRQK